MTTVVRTHGDGAAKLKAALAKLDGCTAQVGWFASAKYKNGTHVAYIAAIHEYGYKPKNIAPRMGLRTMIPEKQQSWSKFANYSAKKVFSGEMTVSDAMLFVASRASADVFKQIASVKTPLLAIATLENRARFYGLDYWTELSAAGQKPLNFTGYMIATLSYVVFQNGTQVAGEMKTGESASK